MSSKICNYNYCIPLSILSKEQIARIKTELTVTPENNFGSFKPQSFCVYKETQKYLIVPIYYALQNEILKKIDNNPDISFPDKIEIGGKCKITLRENQIDCFNSCILEFDKEFGGGIINTSTGFGKTILAIKLIAYAGIKTMIVVNKVELMTQWKEQIEKFIPSIKVGIIQRDKFEVEGNDIVIGTIQTISSRENLTPKDFKWVGMCIIDEVHNIASNVFSKVFFKVRPRYSFGLSATLKRKDGAEKILHWFIGDILYTDEDISMKQESNILVYNYNGISSKEETVSYTGDLNVSKMISNISLDGERNKLILSILEELIKNNEERKILVISERIAQLKFLHKQLGDTVCGLYIGATTKEERIEIKKNKRIILGTYQIVSEGFNHPVLNTLVFATPRSNITQSIGRIYRKKHAIKPVIVDINDNFSLFAAQYYKRKRIYMEQIKDAYFLYK